MAELARIYESKGLKPGLARHVAEELTAHDPLAAHAEAELGIDPGQLAHAAWASFLSFTAGAVLPLLAITLVPGPARIAVTIIAVRAPRGGPGGARPGRGRAPPRPPALGATGAASAALGRAPRRPAVVLNVNGGAIAMGVTYGIGTLIAAAGI